MNSNNKGRNMTDRKTALMSTIVDTVVAAMEAGTAPWQKPWQDRNTDRPQNLLTGKAYNGVNALFLSVVGASPYWVGYKQAIKLGGNVRKGAKATKILFPVIKTREVDGVEKKVVVGFGETNIFNVLTDCEGIELPVVEEREVSFDNTKLDGMIERLGVDLSFGGDRAFYRPSTDQVVMPLAEQFDTERGYWGTLLHELVHWTGGSKRLDRKADKNREGYAFEELVAELGAYYLGELIGVPVEPENHASYLASWLKAIKDDPDALRRAAGLAEKAAKFIAAQHDEEVTI
jgi:antirestriction protein ArdC